MYLANWKRENIFEIMPVLKKNKTVYHKEYISNPEMLDFWNFFIKFKKVRQLTYMLKDTKNVNLISIDGKNALEVALDLQYLPLLKIVLNHNSKYLFLAKNNETNPVLNRIWSVKFNLYKQLLLFIKDNNLECFFTEEHMYLLINNDLEKMIYFEKKFPGLFLKIFPQKIDNLHPKFVYVLLKHDILKTKLSRRLKPKKDKKIIIKI